MQLEGTQVRFNAAQYSWRHSHSTAGAIRYAGKLRTPDIQHQYNPASCHPYALKQILYCCYHCTRLSSSTTTHVPPPRRAHISSGSHCSSTTTTEPSACTSVAPTMWSAVDPNSRVPMPVCSRGWKGCRKALKVRYVEYTLLMLAACAGNWMWVRASGARWFALHRHRHCTGKRRSCVHCLGWIDLS